MYKQNHVKNYRLPRNSLPWPDMTVNMLTGPELPGGIGQSVTCLTADMCLIADPGVAILIPAQSHTFVEIDHEIISTAILLPSADSRRAVVSYKLKCVHEVLVNC